MTAEEIRQEVRDNLRVFNNSRPSVDQYLILIYGMAGELAAQLAELNSKFLRPELGRLAVAAPRLLAAIRVIFKHLNDRIDNAQHVAPGNVPVFVGIAELHSIVEEFKDL